MGRAPTGALGVGEVPPPTVIGGSWNFASVHVNLQTVHALDPRSLRACATLRGSYWAGSVCPFLHCLLLDPPILLGGGQGGAMTEWTWRLGGLERNKTYPSPCRPDPCSSSVFLLVQGRVRCGGAGGRSVWAGRRSGRLFLIDIPYPCLPGSITPPQDPALQTPSPCLNPQRALLRCKSLTHFQSRNLRSQMVP